MVLFSCVILGKRTSQSPTCEVLTFQSRYEDYMGEHMENTWHMVVSFNGSCYSECPSHMLAVKEMRSEKAPYKGKMITKC